MAPTQTFLVVLTHKYIKEPREDGGIPHTHIFIILIVVSKEC